MMNTARNDLSVHISARLIKLVVMIAREFGLKSGDTR